MTPTFRDLGVDDALCDALEAKGITHPFPIQALTLPMALAGDDLIGLPYSAHLASPSVQRQPDLQIQSLVFVII